MRSKLKFFQNSDNSLSHCGEVLEIELASHHLDWSGVIIEKGQSPHFYPNDVYTPYFYFALALERDLDWQVETPDGVSALHSNPGNIWINPPNTPFSHHIEEPCYFVILAVEKQRFLDACPLNIKGKSLCFLNNYNLVDPTIKGIMELFLLQAQAPTGNGTSYLDNLLALLSTHYIQHYSNFLDLEQNNAERSKFDQQQVDKVDRYIEQNLSGNISIEALAECVGCSKFYFLREFKKFVGDTPYQYLISKRLSKAKRLLSQHKHIATVAFELGFNDQAHFTRTFKNEFGLTPGQFIKSL